MRSLYLIAAVFIVFDSVYAGLQMADLTHPFDNTTLYWPTVMGDRFRFYKRISAGSGPTFYSMNMFCSAEHGGTHLDAPIHFSEGKRTVGQIPLSDLIGSVSVINVKQQASRNPDYLIGERDFDEYEKANGRIQDRSIILLNSGECTFIFNGNFQFVLGCIVVNRGGYRQIHDIRSLLKIVLHPLTTPTILKVHTVQQPSRKLLANYSLQIKNEALFNYNLLMETPHCYIY